MDFHDILRYYKQQGAPSDQTALVSLFREVQQLSGGSIPNEAIRNIATEYQVRESFLLAVIKRIPSLRLNKSHCLELCSGMNCGKYVKLAEFSEKACREAGVSFRYCGCMRMCGQGPNLKFDGTVYHRANEELVLKLLQSIKLPTAK